MDKNKRRAYLYASAFCFWTWSLATSQTARALVAKQRERTRSVRGSSLLVLLVYFPSKRPLAPQGSTSPVSDTGSPISFEVVVPSKSFKAVLII